MLTAVQQLECLLRVHLSPHTRSMQLQHSLITIQCVPAHEKLYMSRTSHALSYSHVMEHTRVKAIRHTMS